MIDSTPLKQPLILEQEPTPKQLFDPNRKKIFLYLFLGLTTLFGLGASMRKSSSKEHNPVLAPPNVLYKIVGAEEVEISPRITVEGQSVHLHFNYTSQKVVHVRGEPFYMRRSEQKLYLGDCDSELIRFNDVYHENISWPEIVLVSTRDAKIPLEKAVSSPFDDELMAMVYRLEVAASPTGPWITVEFKRRFLVVYDKDKIFTLAKKRLKM